MWQHDTIFMIRHKTFGIILFLVMAAAAFPIRATSEQAATAPNVAEQYLLAAANQNRAAHGLPPLHRDPILAQAALYHARQMAAHANISHQFPGEPDLSVRGSQCRRTLQPHHGKCSRSARFRHDSRSMDAF